MKLGSLLLAGAALLSATGVGAQTLKFKVDTATSFVKVTANPSACLGNCAVTASLVPTFQDFTLSQGQSKTFNFANFNIGSGLGVGSATIDAQLGFLQPSVSTVDATGHGTYFRTGGFFTPGLTGGVFTWDDPIQQITTADGSKFTVTFDSLATFQFGGKITDKVTVRLDSIAPAVPEPATWAMMLMGFGMIGFGLRYRRKNTSVSFA